MDLCRGLQPRRYDRPHGRRGQDGAALGRRHRDAPRSTHPASRDVLTVAFSPDGKSFLTGGRRSGARLFRKVPELPDDLDRVATWVEVLTGLTLDAGQGTIRVLDNAAWRKRREQLEQLGGPPETGGGPRLDPIPFGTDPIARGRVLIERGRWEEAEAAFDEVVRARPYNASSWIVRGRISHRPRPARESRRRLARRSGFSRRISGFATLRPCRCWPRRPGRPATSVLRPAGSIRPHDGSQYCQSWSPGLAYWGRTRSPTARRPCAWPSSR